ncbi:SIMPL domain-containing protein [Balamuthia mandrillaris]
MKKICLLLLTVLLASCLLLPSSTVYAQEDEANGNDTDNNNDTDTTAPTTDRILTVTGEGTANAAANITEIVLGVEVRSNESAADAIQQAAQLSSNLTEFLQEQEGIENLQTVRISLDAILPPPDPFSTTIFPPPPQSVEVLGYVATNLISFRVVEIDQVGEIIDGAVQAGATRIDSLNVVASDQATAEAKELALQRAVENAKDQAMIVLDALELESRGVASVQIGNLFFPRPIPLFSAAAEAQGGANLLATTPVVGGQQEVSATVVIEFFY